MIELMALMFTGLAGLASAVQAYVSWETRGEVSRAIVFAERIDACAQVIAAIAPFAALARPEAREIVASGSPDGDYSLPGYYYRTPSGAPAFDMGHDPRVERWRLAAAAYSIVAPAALAERIGFFDRMIVEEIPEGRFMKQSEMLARLEALDARARGLTEDCRGFL